MHLIAHMYRFFSQMVAWYYSSFSAVGVLLALVVIGAPIVDDDLVGVLGQVVVNTEVFL